MGHACKVQLTACCKWNFFSQRLLNNMIGKLVDHVVHVFGNLSPHRQKRQLLSKRENMHCTTVSALAEELTLLGHDVVMLIPNSIRTVERHRRPIFPIMLFQEALTEEIPFATGSEPELLHAWTPRQHVRNITLTLAKKHLCPYVLHMEDNEEQIVADEMKTLRFSELLELPLIYQDLLIDNYRSHPTHYRSFAEGAVGYTCLIDRLLEFKPPHIPGLVFWAGYEKEFAPLPEPSAHLRAKYGLSEHETVVLYSGNVHRSIVTDVRNLYLAVALLRKRGLCIRLLRTGWNHADLHLGDDNAISEAAIEVGFVDRAEMPGLLSISDLLVQPGKSDSFNDYRFPSKLPEYLVSGKPVILPASNIGNALIDGRHVLKLHDGTLAELVRRMSQVVSNPTLALNLGRESRAFALETLSWSKSARELNEFYSSLTMTKISHGPISVEAPSGGVKPQSPSIIEHPVKLIAFYLPQFHPIPENDNWWGKGFTEWTNVSRAKPFITAHRQPRLPTELGYYDLRVAETMQEQAKLAEEFGLSGFCFYVYWFEGKRLLEAPVNLWLKRGPDFPFCVCWANENWSRRWDGSENEILIAQNYQDGFEERFIIDMLPILKDSRYIKIGGHPVVAIYRVSDFPDPVANTSALRKAALRHGFQGLHLVMVQSFGLDDPRKYGCDAAIEFSPPHTGRLLVDSEQLGGVDPSFSGYVEDYVGVAAASINADPTDFARYRGCFPTWDNTARRGAHSHILINDSAKAYGYWLRFLVHEAMLRRDQVAPFIFINAWNEWAEGAYLEPDEHYGRTFLEITRAALCHGVADFAQNGAGHERERLFTETVSKLPKLR